MKCETEKKHNSFTDLTLFSCSLQLLAMQKCKVWQSLEACSYIIKVKVSFKQGFSLLFSLRPCPVSLPGHAVLLECGHKSLIWELGLGKQTGWQEIKRKV